MTDRAPDFVTGAVKFERVITIDSKFADRLTAATFRYLLLTPSRMIRAAILSAFVAVIVSQAADPGGLATVGLFIAALPLLPIVYSLIFLIAFRAARKQIRARLPAGSQYSITMSEGSMRMQDSLVINEVSYRLYKSVHANKYVVGIQTARGRIPSAVLPRELFTPESLAWLRERVAQESGLAEALRPADI